MIADRDVEEEMETPGTGTKPLGTEHLVIGVAADVRQTHDDEDFADLYLPLLQQSRRFSFLLAKRPRQGAEWIDDAYRAVAAIDPEVSLGSPRRLQSALDAQRSGPRFLASLLAAFAGIVSAFHWVPRVSWRAGMAAGVTTVLLACLCLSLSRS